VQGVFFRDSTRRKAEAEGIAGWVSNRDDGAVEAVFEGEPEAVERMVDFIRRGPGRAEVESAEESVEEPEGLSGFRIV
jgi:acylphosphatase